MFELKACKRVYIMWFSLDSSYKIKLQAPLTYVAFYNVYKANKDYCQKVEAMIWEFQINNTPPSH